MPIEGGLRFIERDGVEVVERAREDLVSSVEIHSRIEEMVPVPKYTGGTVASNGDVLAYDLALLPLVVGGEYFGDSYLGRSFVSGDGVVVAATVLHGL